MLRLEADDVWTRDAPIADLNETFKEIAVRRDGRDRVHRFCSISTYRASAPRTVRNLCSRRIGRTPRRPTSAPCAEYGALILDQGDGEDRSMEPRSRRDVQRAIVGSGTELPASSDSWKISRSTTTSPSPGFQQVWADPLRWHRRRPALHLGYSRPKNVYNYNTPLIRRPRT